MSIISIVTVVDGSYYVLAERRSKRGFYPTQSTQRLRNDSFYPSVLAATSVAL